MNFSKNALTNAIAAGLQKGPMSKYSLDPQSLNSNNGDDPSLDVPSADDIDKSISNNQPAPTSSGNKDDYFSAAKQDLDDARAGGITKDQLDTLHKHEGATMWASLFMNLIGASHGLDSSPYSAPLQKRVDQERQGLNKQQEFANQQANRAALDQRLGMGNIESSNALRQQSNATVPLTTAQQGAVLAYAKQAGISVDPNDLKNATQETYNSIFSPLKDLSNSNLRQQQLQNTAQLYSGKNKVLVPTLNSDGTVGQSVFDKNSLQQNEIPNSVVPQTMKINQQSNRDFIKALKPETIAAHEAVQNYDTALEGLKPDEAKQVDDLARRQISAIAGKFDQGVKSNVITNTNQLLNSIVKMEQTGEFDTPDNPAVGQAAFRRVKSALEFASITQGAKTKPSNFATQFSLGNSFGSNLAGNPVPQEKIDELKNETKQNIGGNLQQAISATSNPDIAKQKAKELFEDHVDDYLKAYHNIRGPGYKENSNNQTQQPTVLGHGVMSADDYLKSLK